MDARIILSTAGSPEAASKLAQSILTAKLAACVTVLPGAQSHYWWQGSIHSDTEAVMIIKTRVGLVDELQKLFRTEHSYETPEFVVIAPESVEPRYLAWLIGSLDNP